MKAKVPDSTVEHAIGFSSQEVDGLDGLVLGRHVFTAGLQNKIVITCCQAAGQKVTKRWIAAGWGITICITHIASATFLGA